MRPFNYIHNTIQALCQPNPKLYPDPLTRQFIWKRNLMSFYSCLTFKIISLVFSSIYEYSPALKFCNIGAMSFFLLLFLFLCRSYLWVFNTAFAVFISLIGFPMLENIPDSPYFFLGSIFVFPPVILVLSNDIRFASFAGVMKTFICLTKYKEKFIILLRQEEPEIFAEKLINMTVFLFFIMMIMNLCLLRTFEERSVELSRAKSTLETALENQKTFIFSFSHELRNPINSLLGNLHLVLQGEILSAKASEMIKVAKTCGEILLHNINNVLETGKYDIGKLEVNAVATQVHKLFQRTWGIYNELLRQRKLEGKLKIDQNIPLVLKIDAHKVNQILLNLIGNSIKFTEQGTIGVSCKWLQYGEVEDECFEPKPYDEEDEGIFEKDENLARLENRRFSKGPRENFLIKKNLKSAREEEKPEIVQEEVAGVLKIIVRDTGSGMKKEALEKLFKKFSQVSENVAQRQIGTGLGLFITKEICQAMNGDIRAYSKPGVGTAFVVCIPTVALPLNDPQNVGTQSIIKQLSERHLKVLIADDSPFNVNLMSDYLSKCGGSVLSTAYNGFDILMKYQECRRDNLDIDCVILDIHMPIMDGKTACTKIREFEKENKLKPAAIILVSGNFDKEQIEKYVGSCQAGLKADGFLKKPISGNEFIRAVYHSMIKN